MDMELFKEMAAKAQGKSLIGACLAEIEALRQQLASVAKERDEIAAQSRMLDCMVDERDEQLAAALVAIEEKDAALSAIIGATRSHVDGRDLLAELHPRHYMDIRVRRNGKDIWFEADWLSNLQRAITSYKTTIPIKPNASALKQHDEALNWALGGEDSTSIENLIDAHEVHYSDEGLIALCRKLTQENIRLEDVVLCQKKAWTADFEELERLRDQLASSESSPVLNRVKAEALRDAADEFDAQGEWKGHGQQLRKMADDIEKGEWL